MIDTVEMRRIVRIFDRTADSRENFARKYLQWSNGDDRIELERMIGEAQGFRDARDILDELCRSVEG